jgi:hypothetical protein
LRHDFSLAAIAAARVGSSEKLESLLNQVGGLAAAGVLLNYGLNAVVFGAAVAIVSDSLYLSWKKATKPLE